MRPIEESIVPQRAHIPCGIGPPRAGLVRPRDDQSPRFGP